jgi:catechol 2,3-dioxygenase-like lactoylglutathione lyase family enzyme
MSGAFSHAPLPLAGTFHEFSVAVDDVRGAVEFYERLGFTQANTSDAFTHPYGVLTDARLFIGLHQRSGPSPTLTFVRPGIAASLAAFATAGIHLSRCRTGEEVFNEIAFSDPFGHEVAVLEARTYSPVARKATEVSLCGDFAEVSLPARDFAAAQAFWEPLGFVAAEEAQVPYPHLTLTSDHLDLAFHAPQLCARPMLVFRAADMGARVEHLRTLGLSLGPPPPQVSGAGSASLEAPGGTPLLLLEVTD